MAFPYSEDDDYDHRWRDDYGRLPKDQYHRDWDKEAEQHLYDKEVERALLPENLK